MRLLLLTIAAASGAAGLLAEVTRIDIEQRGPFADGARFGEVGAYERISGRMFIEVDPDDPANAAYVFGVSQSGRLIHYFIHEGFNQDEARRPVFDGALIHAAGAGKGTFNHRFRMTTDFGPRFHTEGIADIVPPKMGRNFHALIPAVDADGNEIAGIRLPDVAAPLGAFTGWNLRAAGSGAEGILARLEGMYLPFALTAEQRRKQGDPRPSVRERYPTREDYLARMEAAARNLQRQGLLLAEDAARILETAARRRLWDSSQ